MCVSLESRALTPAVWATWPAQRKKKNCFSECCCGGGGGGGGEGVNRNFLGQKNHPFYFVTTRRGEKAKAAGGGGDYRVSLSSERVAGAAALCGPPDFSAFAEECVFVSEDFRWS